MREVEAFQGTLEATVHTDRTNTWTTVMLVSERFAGIGTAKRHPNDQHNSQIGYDVAVSRALRDLADDIEAGAGSA